MISKLFSHSYHRINSSKVYCKFKIRCSKSFSPRVLIVAKCIVNWTKQEDKELKRLVLIVAKCIVNWRKSFFMRAWNSVLIVAKCIVNEELLVEAINLQKY